MSRLTEIELIKRLVKVIKESDEDSNKSNNNLLVSLRDYAKGKISNDELYDADKSIEHISKKSPLGNSILTIKFDDDDEFIDGIDLSKDDVWFLHSLNSYGGHDFLDSYTVKEDFMEGYNVYSDLDEENTEKLKEISSLILSNKEFKIEDEEFRMLLSKTLYDMYPKEINEILYSYEIEKEREMTIVAEKTVKKEFYDVLKNIGIGINSMMDEVNVEVVDLYMNAFKLNMYNKNAKEIILAMVKNDAEDLGGWWDNVYDFQDYREFDNEEFNKDTGRELDNILEKINSKENIQEYYNLRERILSKFKLDTWHKLPKDKKYSFTIRGIDMETLKISIYLKGPLGFKNIMVSEENFNHLLYQPTLFDLTEI